MKNPKEIEQIVKGFSNHYRIRVLELLKKHPGLDVLEISARLKANYKTISVHIRRLHQSGLIEKQHKAAYVEHRLTKRGEIILKFLRILE